MVWYKRLSHLYAHTKDSTIVHYVIYASTVQYTYVRKYILHFMTGQIVTVPIVQLRNSPMSRLF